VEQFIQQNVSLCHLPIPFIKPETWSSHGLDNHRLCVPFSAVYVQHRLIFFRRFLFIDTTCFGITGHHHVYRLLWWRNLLLTAMLSGFSYVLASDSRLCGLTSCFIWVSLNNCYARVCLICNIWCVKLELYFKVYMYIQFLYILCMPTSIPPTSAQTKTFRITTGYKQ
jgi:hypothetical protein